MEVLLQDIRYAARKLQRSPGFTAIALTTLALAIGATTAVFSIVNGVLLKPLAFRNPDEIVRVATLGRDGKPTLMSGPDFIDYRDQSHSFVGMAGLNSGNVNFTRIGTQPMRLNASYVGARFFELLGVNPQMGRAFAANEDSVGAPHVAILSDKIWRGQFNADPRVLGQGITLDGNLYTVIGVAPPSLNYPTQSDLWLPFQFESWMTDPSNRGAHFMNAIGRVKPGVSIETARREIASIAKGLSVKFPRSNGEFGGEIIPLREQIVGNVQKLLYTMLGAVGFVLLIACANVANLLLVRATAREGEMAVRTALGAGRKRIIRQLVTESVILSVIGAVIGAAIASWTVDAVVVFGPRGLPRLDEVGIDSTVLLFSIGVALLTGVLFGLIPALHAARSDIGSMLRDSSRGSSGRGARHRTRNLLVVGEMGLAVVLLVGAGLLIKSFINLVNVDPGFRTEHVVSFDVSVPDLKYPFDRDKRRFVNEVTAQLAQIHGTQSVATVFSRPLQRRAMRTIFTTPGRLETVKDRPVTDVEPATASYFNTLGIKLLRGRLFTKDEETFGPPPVLVVTEAFVKKHFPNEDPIGKHITLGISHDTAQANKTPVTTEGEIVGIVSDVKQWGLKEDVVPAVYVPFGVLPLNDMGFLVRSDADLSVLSSAIRLALRAVDPDLPLYELQTMDAIVSESVSQPRFYMVLLAGFAGLALLLAALGIYGVISYTVSERKRELGIRIALGATQSRVLRLVLGQGLALTGVGIVIGLAGAFWLTRLLAALLFGVNAGDAMTFVAVAVVLGVVAAVASYLPARRAAAVDPVNAMRAE